MMPLPLRVLTMGTADADFVLIAEPLPWDIERHA
jgi:hypothetical protein